MKKNIFDRIAVLVLLFFLIVGTTVLSGCQGSGEKEKTTGTAETIETGSEETSADEPPVTIVSEGTSDYVILYPKTAGPTTVRIAEQLRDTIKEKTGVTLQIFSADKRTESEKEILIGEMDERQASLDVGKTVRIDDFAIAVVGNRVILIGGNETRTVSAVNRFISSYVNEATDGNLTVPAGTLVRKDGSYAVTELTLGGVDISEFRIVYSAFHEDFFREAMEKVQTRVMLVSGVRLKAVPSSVPATGHELLFGNCGRDVSNELTVSGMQYAIASDGSSIAFAAGSAMTAKWGVQNLLDQYLPVRSSGKTEISLPVEKVLRDVQIGKTLIEGADLRIMSSNVLFLDSNDGSTRSNLLKEIYMEYYPDVIGLQECDSSAHGYIINGLSSYYSVACRTVGTSSSKSYTPILYRADRCKLLDSGSKLFNQQADGSKSKILSWAVFNHLPSGRVFAIINVHAAIVTETIQKRYEEKGWEIPQNGVEGAAWREDNSREILERFDQLLDQYGADLPVFIMGDMNATASAESIQMLDRREELGNCIDLATVSKTTGIRSWHDLGKTPPSGNPIDHIFVTKDTVHVYTHYLNTSTDALKSSDHCQLICEVAWK